MRIRVRARVRVRVRGRVGVRAWVRVTGAQPRDAPLQCGSQLRREACVGTKAGVACQAAD